MNFPDVIVAGDTLDFKVTVPDYLPTAGWTLKYRLAPRFTAPVQAPITIAASANADGTYQVQQSPTQTAAWAPGEYSWARWVEKSGARQTLSESGALDVRQDPATAAQGYDARSHARKVLAAIEAVLESRASVDQEEMQIGNRSLKRTPLSELTALRNQYRAEVAKEDNLEAIKRGRAPNNRLQFKL